MLAQMAESGRTDDQTASATTLPERDGDASADARTENLVTSGPAPGGETGGDSIRRPPSVALLADLERRVRRLEARVDGLERPGSPSRRLVRASDLVRWGLWLVVIGFLAYYWLKMGAAQ
jgi:hypothetical protein